MGLHSKQRSCFDITLSSTFLSSKVRIRKGLPSFFYSKYFSLHTFAGKKKKRKKKRNQTPLHWSGFHLQFALTKTIQKDLGKGLKEVATCNCGAAAETLKSPTHTLGTTQNILGSPCLIWSTCELYRPPYRLKNIQLSYGCPTVSWENKQSSL